MLWMKLLHQRINIYETYTFLQFTSFIQLEKTSDLQICFRILGLTYWYSISRIPNTQMLFSTVDLIFDSNTELLERLKEEMKANITDPMIGEVFSRTIDKLCQYYGV